MIDLSTVRKEDFDSHINTPFKITTDENLHENLELIETSSSSTEQVASFKLLFKSASDVIHPQKTYKLVHTKMGEMDIFIVPINKDETSVYYEAIFSRLIKKEE